MVVQAKGLLALPLSTKGVAAKKRMSSESFAHHQASIERFCEKNVCVGHIDTRFR